jgi:hypothetical protein
LLGGGNCQRQSGRLKKGKEAQGFEPRQKFSKIELGGKVYDLSQSENLMLDKGKSTARVKNRDKIVKLKEEKGSRNGLKNVP